MRKRRKDKQRQYVHGLAVYANVAHMQAKISSIFGLLFMTLYKYWCRLPYDGVECVHKNRPRPMSELLRWEQRTRKTNFDEETAEIFVNRLFSYSASRKSKKCINAFAQFKEYQIVCAYIQTARSISMACAIISITFTLPRMKLQFIQTIYVNSSSFRSTRKHSMLYSHCMVYAMRYNWGITIVRVHLHKEDLFSLPADTFSIIQRRNKCITVIQKIRSEPVCELRLSPYSRDCRKTNGERRRTDRWIEFELKSSERVRLTIISNRRMTANFTCKIVHWSWNRDYALPIARFCKQNRRSKCTQTVYDAQKWMRWSKTNICTAHYCEM